MLTRPSPLLRACLLTAALVVASTSQPAHPADSKFLSEGDMDPALILPPPPADDSAEHKEEAAELHSCPVVSLSPPVQVFQGPFDRVLEKFASPVAGTQFGDLDRLLNPPEAVMR